MTKGFALIGTLLFLLSIAHATIWYVHPDSTLNSIQAGLDSCYDNDTVLVGPGTYYENIIWPNTHGVYLVSELGPDTTIVDGDSAGSVIVIEDIGEDSAIVINGFTVRNGYSEDGGGIYCYLASPTIINNIIIGNQSSWNGGGIYLLNARSPVITGNFITENEAGLCGGGIEVSSIHGSSEIIANTIIGNTSPNGGGINCHCDNSEIIDNIISFNTGFQGGGILSQGSLFMNNNVVTSNTATYRGGGVYCSYGFATIKNTSISGNTSPKGAGLFSDVSTTIEIDTCIISYNYGDGFYCDHRTTVLLDHNNIMYNTEYGVNKRNQWFIANAENNWWGDATGPYHPITNPSGQGDSVSDYVDYDPWLGNPVGVAEKPTIKPIETHDNLGATIFTGPLPLLEGKKYKVFDITGRVVMPDKMRPGIYFIEVDGKVVKKAIKIR